MNGKRAKEVRSSAKALFVAINRCGIGSLDQAIKVRKYFRDARGVVRNLEGTGRWCLNETKKTHYGI